MACYFWPLVSEPCNFQMVFVSVMLDAFDLYCRSSFYCGSQRSKKNIKGRQGNLDEKEGCGGQERDLNMSRTLTIMTIDVFLSSQSFCLLKSARSIRVPIFTDLHEINLLFNYR